MGYIKEPKGVDFIIKSEPLTDEDRKAISTKQNILKRERIRQEPLTRKGLGLKK